MEAHVFDADSVAPIVWNNHDDLCSAQEAGMLNAEW
jgi:hypothetical protein